MLYYFPQFTKLIFSWLFAMAEPLQQPATKKVCKTRGCSYSFWAPDVGRCVTQNMLSN
jgi:hypothetical protein